MFGTIDYLVFGGYALLIIFMGWWVSRKKSGETQTAADYFLAGQSLPWWAIGASLIAANISAEQFIGMSGSGYAIGLGIAAYEWMAAITLIIVGKYFLPLFLEKKIYTMPQFLEMRFDNRVRTSLAVFWLLVYVFVNLTSVLYLGALTIKTVMDVDLMYGIIGLAIVAVLYSSHGGLTSVAWTDVVQVVFLIGGGLITTYLAVNAVSGGEGFWAGISTMLEKAPEKFDLILSSDNPNYKELPGISVLIGGMWIMNLSYWGLNQYITQRALAAKSLREAQRGVIFAGYLKLLLPLIVVIPGIAAFALSADITKSDEAYPWLLNSFVPVGVKGLAFAALAAAIVSSLGSMMNSTATIFTLDIYKHFFNREASDSKLVSVGRITSVVALAIAVVAAQPLLGQLDQAFQYIQEYTGFVTPGVVVIFILGLFWKRTTANAALAIAILTIPLSAVIKFVAPDFPFMDRMGVVFLVLVLVGVVVSMLESKTAHSKAIVIQKGVFNTDMRFNVLATIIFGIVTALYIAFW